MMPQQESGEATSSDYGRYEGERSYQQFEKPYQEPEREGAAGKLYTTAPDNKNMLRLIAFGMALAALVVMALICLVFVGGTGGWISFAAASLTIFITAAIAIDKIQ